MLKAKNVRASYAFCHILFAISRRRRTYHLRLSHADLYRFERVNLQTDPNKLSDRFTRTLDLEVPEHVAVLCV